MVIDLNCVPTQTASTYPAEFQPAVAGRMRQRVGEAAGLTNFGVNVVTLLPGAASALRHWHTHQDEFIYVIAGDITLITETGAQLLTSGMMAGFAANDPNGHHLVNQSDQPAQYLEIGDRTGGDRVSYPDHDLVAAPSATGYDFSHRDGTPYD